MVLTWQIVIIIFAAFCVLQLVFNIVWKLVESKMTLNLLNQKMDLIYSGIIKRILVFKEEIKKNEV